MKRTLLGACFLTLAVAAGAASSPALVSGIDMQNVDAKVRPQDDFFRYVNGNWLAKTRIPADKSGWGAFYEVAEDTSKQLRGIVEKVAAQKQAPGSIEQKIADLYKSFMAKDRLETLGLKPLAAELRRIRALKAKRQIPALIAYFNEIGVTAPYAPQIHQDNRDSTRYIVDLGQDGLGLPDRDYYLKDDDAKLKAVRVQYQAHIGRMLALAGDKAATGDAARIVALETELARVQWTKVENRDPQKTYNKLTLPKLDRLTPGYGWSSYLAAAGLKGRISYLIVSQPSYLAGFNQVLKKTPLPVWRAYFTWHLLSHYAPDLDHAYVAENFAFYGTALSGIPREEPRWKRAVRLIDNAIGEGLGKLYVGEYFPPENKARMEQLVANLIAAYRQSIDTLDWMSPATKKAAQAKLAMLMTKIGYPSKWRDYSKLAIAPDDLVGNVRRAAVFEYRRETAKLGGPIDRSEWDMTPQTVNAYYNPELNEVVFPAAILQPPFFDVHADPAVNYGGIGAVIGHEISHGFDDQGSQYDGAGNLHDWWTPQDHKKFAAKTSALVKQYGAFSPVPGYPVNGALTLGENIADNSGLAIAYKAYHLSLAGKPAPVIDGLTGDQRFFMGFAQVWRTKMRDEMAIVRIKSDPHSPPQFRVKGTLQNQPGFYAAFDVKPGDKMYLPPDARVTIW
ncbi:neutral endopeptidase [mine drainage metagenome]|uniref:Neutral endopeptidase n=1 Tax=mine drainage metagenome TaxID=410659 RepID=A0A1J5R181_9ZZZZ